MLNPPRLVVAEVDEDTSSSLSRGVHKTLLKADKPLEVPAGD